jgi:hypothetical protein
MEGVQKRPQKWFIVILVLDTMALLEIIYIFYFANKKVAENKA